MCCTAKESVSTSVARAIANCAIAFSRAATSQEWGLVVRRFTEMHGDLPIDLIEKQHAVAYKDKMVDNGATPATIRKHMGALHSLLQLAVDNGLCTINVARGVKVRGSKVAAQARLPYD